MAYNFMLLQQKILYLRRTLQVYIPLSTTHTQTNKRMEKNVNKLPPLIAKSSEWS